MNSDTPTFVGVSITAAIVAGIILGASIGLAPSPTGWALMALSGLLTAFSMVLWDAAWDDDYKPPPRPPAL